MKHNNVPASEDESPNGVGDGTGVIVRFKSSPIGIKFESLIWQVNPAPAKGSASDNGM